MKDLIKIIYVLALVFASTFLVANLTGVLSIEQIKSWVQMAHQVSPVYVGPVVILLLFCDLFFAVPMLTITILSGYFLGFPLGGMPEEPSIYLSSDTIYTGAVHKVLTEFQPDISVAACGSAQFDIFGPLLMTMDDILKFFSHTPGKVIANHLVAINHCHTIRTELQQKVAKNNMQVKVWIPEDGDTIDLDA